MSKSSERSVSVSLKEVSRTFGAFVALQPISLDVPAGQFVSLLGPSGCGKTTTLRLIAGLETPDSGSIFIGDRDVTRVASNRRKLGMVFQNYALFPHMTVAENIGFGLRMAGVGKADVAARVSRMLDMIHLPAFGDRLPSRLSGGQQQRVALARSLITEPAVLLLDEPMAALDKNLRESMQFELRQIQQNFGTTTILVTHDQEEALTLSDLVVVMEGGRILQSGAPQEIYNNPTSRFVSEFLGASNLIACDVLSVAADGSAELRPAMIEGAPLRVDASADVTFVAGASATLVVRPEKLRLDEAPGDVDRFCVPARIVQHVFRGASHAYRLEVEGSEQILLVYEQADAARSEAVRPIGSRVYASWPKGAQSVLQDPSR